MSSSAGSTRTPDNAPGPRARVLGGRRPFPAERLQACAEGTSTGRPLAVREHSTLAAVRRAGARALPVSSRPSPRRTRAGPAVLDLHEPQVRQGCETFMTSPSTPEASLPRHPFASASRGADYPGIRTAPGSGTIHREPEPAQPGRLARAPRRREPDRSLIQGHAGGPATDRCR